MLPEERKIVVIMYEIGPSIISILKAFMSDSIESLVGMCVILCLPRLFCLRIRWRGIDALNTPQVPRSLWDMHLRVKLLSVEYVWTKSLRMKLECSAWHNACQPHTSLILSIHPVRYARPSAVSGLGIARAICSTTMRTKFVFDSGPTHTFPSLQSTKMTST